jgi:fluoride exporter
VHSSQNHSVAAIRAGAGASKCTQHTGLLLWTQVLAKRVPAIPCLMFAYDGRELAAVFAGGALGTVARAAVATVAGADPARWPWPTFTVNIVGAFLVGYFTTRLMARLPLSSYRRPMLCTGLCGGLTTFSTMQVETLGMLEHHHYGLAAGYIAASIVAGLVAVYLATAMVRRVRVRR